jgi:hypothetical protein
MVSELRTVSVTVGYPAWVRGSPSREEVSVYLAVSQREPAQDGEGKANCYPVLTASKRNRMSLAPTHRASTGCPPSPHQSWVVIPTMWRPSSPEHAYGVAGESDTAV